MVAATEHLPFRASAEFDARRWIELERLRLVYRNLPVTLLSSLVSALLVVVLLRDAAPVPALLGWFALGVLILWNRYRNYRQFQRLPDQEINTDTWTSRLKIGTAFSGLFWGSVGAVFFPEGDLPHQAIILFVLAGISAGAMTSYAPIRGSYFLFVIPTTLPIIVRLVVEGTEIHYEMAALSLLFLAVVSRAALENHRTISDVLKVRAENTALTHALRHQATHDGLVDLVNHREFNARLAQVSTLAAKLKEPYALLFIDLDRFKQINDTAGHAAGDETLRRIGHILKAGIRASDTAARLGGDEFAILLPGCPRERAEQIAARVHGAIQALMLDFGPDKRFRVGASIGVAYTNAGEHDAAAMLLAADAACYAAKNSGRGRVEVHQADPRCEESGRFELSKLKALPDACDG